MIESLLRPYFTHGLFFAYCHAVILAYVTYTLWQFHNWLPVHHHEAWQEFESRAQHTRGVIGLFLLVGIAGTFWGLLRIAGGGSDPKLFQEALKSGISTAFPVGLMGLLLALVFNFLADSLEQRKTRQISAFISTGSESIADAVRAGLREGTAELTSRILELTNSLEPVRTLEGTLRGALEPTVRELGSQLQEATKLLAEQGDRLEKQTGAILGASAELTLTAKAMEKALASIGDAAEKAPIALEATRAASEAAASLLESNRTALAESAASNRRSLEAAAGAMNEIRSGIDSARQSLLALPEQLSLNVAEKIAISLREVTAEARTQLGAVGSEAIKIIENTNSQGFRFSNESRVRLEELVSDHIAKVGRLAGEFTDLHNRALNVQEVLRDQVQAILTATGEDFSHRVAAAVKSSISPLQEVGPHASALADSFRETSSQLGARTVDAVSKLSESSQKIVRAGQEASATVNGALAPVLTELERFRTTAERISRNLVGPTGPTVATPVAGLPQGPVGRKKKHWWDWSS